MSQFTLGQPQLCRPPAPSAEQGFFLRSIGAHNVVLHYDRVPARIAAIKWMAAPDFVHRVARRQGAKECHEWFQHEKLLPCRAGS